MMTNIARNILLSILAIASSVSIIHAKSGMIYDQYFYAVLEAYRNSEEGEESLIINKLRELSKRSDSVNSELVELLDYYIGEYPGEILADLIVAQGKAILPFLQMKKNEALGCLSKNRFVCSDKDIRNDLIDMLIDEIVTAISNENLASLREFVPCLKGVVPETAANLEDCLYRGEAAVTNVIPFLDLRSRYISKYMNENDAIDELLKPYRAIGISLFYIGGSHYYRHEFFKALQAMRPRSKYREEVDFVLIESAAGTENWEKRLSAMEEYIERFPVGKNSLRVRMKLARFYCGLWDLSHPDHKDWGCLIANLPKNAELAAEFKKKALSVYNDISIGRDHLILSDAERSWLRKSIETLEMNNAGFCMFEICGPD